MDVQYRVRFHRRGRRRRSDRTGQRRSSRQHLWRGQRRWGSWQWVDLGDHTMTAPVKMRFLRRIVLTTALALAQTLLVPNAVNAQTFSVIHTFTGGTDGGIPIAGLTIDSAGNLYGTTVGGGMRKPACGGSFGCGVVFKLSQHNGSWVLSTLYQFRAGNDGAGPVSRVIFGPNGRLYGTTEVGGIGCTDNTGCGTVFSLAPPITVCRSIICSWTETVLYRFTGASDGANPLSEVVFDRGGNLYGTT